MTLSLTRRSLVAGGLSVAALAGCPRIVRAQPAAGPAIADLTGHQIIERVNARDDGRQVTRRFAFELTDRAGVTRLERAISYRKYFGAEKRSVLFYEEPTNIRGTGFLTFDYPDPSVDDDQWLYLPALRRVRRISAADRGGYFLGTDFSYEEIKKEQKVEITDFTFDAQDFETVDGHQTRVVAATSVSDEIADEIGYSRIVYRVDPAIWMSRYSDYYDLNGNHLKTIRLIGVETIDGIITATEITCVHHRTGHSTRLVTSDVDYDAPVRDRLFTQDSLRRGL